MSEPLRIDGREIRVQASLAISVYPHDGDAFGPLLHRADVSMYEAKHRARIVTN